MNRLFKPHCTQGFTFAEILVGILLLAAFSGTALQALVAATAFKVRAEETSEATSWMQQDLEWIRYKAQKIGFSSVMCRAGAPSQGYGQKLSDTINGTGLTEQLIDHQSSIGQRPYVVKRATSIRNLAPYNTLAITYTVTRSTATGPAIAQLYSEVVPDAFMACAS